MDLRLNGSGDATIANGDLVLVDGLDAIAQDVQLRLQMFAGEWFLDTRAGVPYFDRILVKNRSIPDVLALLSTVVTGTPGVNAITEALAWSYDAAARAGRVTFKADTVAGPLVYDRPVLLPAAAV